jgi:CHAT domain-containing protein/tetratricopeptide (TPR) repeat protein
MSSVARIFSIALEVRRNRWSILVGGLLFFAGTADYFGNSKRILQDADRLAMLSNFSQAATLFEKAATLASLTGDHRTVLLGQLGYLWATAETGRTVSRSFDLDRILNDASVQDDPRLRLRFLVAQAARDRVINEASARPVWEKIELAAKAADDPRWQARAEAEIGEIAYLEGDVKAAVRMLKHAILAQIAHRDVGAVIYYASIVGNGLVEAGQPEVGLGYCNGVIKMARLLSSVGFPFLAYQGKARALNALHRFDEAGKLVKTALMEARAQGNRAAEAQLLIVAGEGAQDPKKAVAYLMTASKLSEQSGFKHASAWSAMELAKAFRNVGDITRAESYAARGLVAMRSLDDKYHLPQHLALMAELKARAGKAGEADELYEQASDVIEAVLMNAPSRQIQSSLISTLSDVYLGHFTLAAGKLKDVRKAYQVIERARGRSLSDSLRDDRRAVLTSSDPISAAANQEINSIQAALLHEIEPNRREELLERLFETEQRFTPVRKPIEVLRSVPGRLKPVSLFDLQRQMHTDEVLLEYVLAEPKSFCIRVTRAGGEIVILPGSRGEIEHAVDIYLTAVVAGKSDVELGRWLYSVLLRSSLGRDGKPKVIIVPDGKLNVLPFDSLVDENGRRLLEAHAFSYCPSGTVLFLMRSTAGPRNYSERFLGVADARYPSPQQVSTSRHASGVPGLPSVWGVKGGGFEALPDTRDEVIAVSRILGWQNTLLLGLDATEAHFKAQPLSDYDVIHIATHGVPSVEFPDRSALVLTPDASSGEDGLLQAREIRDLPIRSKLVVLSACETGMGSLRGEEGIASLERAFLYAGAESVVANLWTADDVYTAHLMALFYTHLAKGEDRSVALQRAKLESMRRLGTRATPFYWAGFVIVGDGSGPVANARKAPDSLRSPS